MQPILLVIDDDVRFGELLSETLSDFGIVCHFEPSGRLGIDRLKTGHYKLVILDLMMPEISGFEVLSHIRAFSSVPVLMLTARGNPRDIVTGLHSGADDYLAKPFNDDVLVARIRALLRRTSSAGLSDVPKDVITLGDLELTNSERVAKVRSQLLPLTLAEFETLRALVQAAGETVSRVELCRVALGRMPHPMDRGVDNLVMAVRKKLVVAGCQHCEIRSARGVGYMLIVRRADLNDRFHSQASSS